MLNIVLVKIKPCNKKNYTQNTKLEKKIVRFISNYMYHICSIKRLGHLLGFLKDRGRNSRWLSAKTDLIISKKSQQI